MKGLAPDTIVNIARGDTVDSGVMLEQLKDKVDISIFGNETDCDFHPCITMQVPAPAGTKLVRIRPMFGPDILGGGDTVIRTTTGDIPMSAVTTGTKLLFGAIAPNCVGRTDTDVLEVQTVTLEQDTVLHEVVLEQGQQYALQCGVLFLG